MKELVPVQRFAGSLLVLVLWLFARTIPAETAITPLGTLGGSYVSVYDFNQAGVAAGNGLTADNLAQHAVLFQNGAAVDLGTLGGSIATVFALNNRNQAAGMSSTPDDLATHAFLWENGVWRDLGTLGGDLSMALEINELGQVAGDSYLADGWNHAFLFADNRLIDLGTLGGSYSSARGINSRGQVVGEATLADDAGVRAFRFDGAALVDMGTLGGNYSTATDINDTGWVVGESVLANELDSHAFLHDGSRLVDLGTLGGRNSTAYGINPAGWVIGDAALAGDNEWHGFLYREGALVDLGTLGGPASSAWAINGQGQVVGESLTPDFRSHAFLWENGVMTDLNSLLPAESGWELYSANSINDAGQIVGAGFYQGAFGYYLLTVQAAPANRPPVAEAGPGQRLECTGTLTPVVLSGVGSSDPDGNDLQFAWAEGGRLLGQGPTLAIALSQGVHEITLTVTDPQGAAAQDTVVVLIEDSTPPTIQAVTANPAVLFPPNRRFQPVTLTVSVADSCDPVPSVRIAGVTRNGVAAGASARITGPLTVDLLAERGQRNEPVVYEITVQAVDASGNRSSATVTVPVESQPGQGGGKDKK